MKRIFLYTFILMLAGSPAFFQAGLACASAGLHEEALEPISGIIEQAVAEGRIPGAVALIGTGDRIVLRKAFGWRSLYPDKTPMTADVIFDTASLTKVIATATAVMQLVEAQKLRLDDPAAKHWPAFGKNGKGKITLRHLLTHYSGLRAEPKLGPGAKGSEAILKAITLEKPLHPPGGSYRYSDTNFIVLGEIVRRVSGLPLDRYCLLHIFDPLGMKDTAFTPSTSLSGRIAPTLFKDGRYLCGEVHDPVCFRMGGVCGHAGVFSTADDLAAFARMMLGGGKAGEKIILRPESLEMMTRPQSPAGAKRFRGLGWDLEAPFAANADELAPLGAYSHLGYTGTGIWIDPVSGTYLILLTNRVHAPGGGNVRDLRQAVKKQMAQAVGSVSQDRILELRPSLSPFVSQDGRAAFARPVKVETGIDVLEKENYASLAGLTVGLITNHTGCNASGIRTIDLLHRAPGVKLAAIFSPEHGIDGRRDAWVPSTNDGKTGLPIYSLYGESRRPAKEALEGLDALVFDLQDAGVRFYTYISTMGYVMEAAAQKGIPLFVLDRPNPITADRVEGPVSDDIPKSFTSYFPLPVRHGMTVGELARMFNAEYKIGADLRVIPMRGYDRASWYDETGLAWINPSPNLRSLKAATLYPGVALAEGANVSVGRGTPTPFELIGAPWIRAKELSRVLERRGISGVRFYPVRFKPETGIFRGQWCQGVRIKIPDRERLDAPCLGIEVIAALYRLYPASFRLDNTLGMIGSKKVTGAIRAGQDPKAICASWRDSLNDFRTRRSGYLLY